MTPAEAAATYAEDLDRYAAAADELEDVLRRMCRGLRVPATLQKRVKSRPSLVKKALKIRRGAGGSAIPDRVDDIVGLRIILPSQEHLERVKARLAAGPFESFKFFGHDDKTAELAPTQLGYRGYHAQVVVPGHFCSSGEAIEAEVQLRTQAEDLWNSTEHKLNYKGILKPAPETQRRLMRLSVLTEIFDQEVALVMQAIQSDPAYANARLLNAAENLYLQFADAPGDNDLSFEVLEQISEALDDADADDYAVTLEAFVDRRRRQLADLYADYGGASVFGGDVAYWLFSQPESIIVLQLLEAKPMALAGAVRGTELEVPVELLSASWGKALPEL